MGSTRLLGAVVLPCFLMTSLSAQLNREAPRFTPTIDGTVTADEMAGQLEVPMVWPIETGSLLLEQSGFGEEDISATWYVSWDDTNLNIAGVVLDNTPIYRLPSGGAYNAQDLIQPVFNPLNDEDHLFVDGILPEDEVFDEVAAIYDFVVETSDEFGPDVYRHGHLLSEEGYESITIAGTINDDESGYTIEASIPWATAMDDEQPDYKPSIGDVHGLSFIIISFNDDAGAGAAATLITDFGEGGNTIGDPTTWNTITLVSGAAQPGDFDADGDLDVDDIEALSAAVRNADTDPKFDMNGDGSVTSDDRRTWVADIRKTWFGDSNLDGEFNSSDLVAVFTAGKFETREAATWGQGDWDGDQQFGSSDLVAAFTDGGYEIGPRPAAAAVPEPAAAALLGLGLLAVLFRRAKVHRTG